MGIIDFNICYVLQHIYCDINVQYLKPHDKNMKTSIKLNRIIERNCANSGEFVEDVIIKAHNTEPPGALV